MAVPKKRTSKKKQFRIYLQKLEEHPALINGKMELNGGPDVLKNIWENLAVKLNSCGDRSIRTVPEWKKAFTEWKSSTRKKTREGKTTTEQQMKLIELTGSGAVTGVPIDEIGTKEKVEAEEGNLMVEYLDHNQEEILIEIVEEPAGATRVGAKGVFYFPHNNVLRIRKTTGDVLCDAYANAISETNNSLDKISQSILEIAKAFNRYCDILEKT